MSGPGVQVGSGYIRVIAKTLPADYEEFKRRWQQGLEQALQGLHLNQPIISQSTVVQQGQHAGNTLGTQISQSTQQQVQSHAPQIVAPIAAQGNNAGSSFGKAVVAGFIAAKTMQLIGQGMVQGMELQGASNKLQAQLGLSPQDAAKYSETVKKLFNGAYGESIEEVQNAMGGVISSIDGMKNASSEALEEMTKKSLTFANTFEVDVARSTQIVGQMVRGGMVKDASEGFDLLTKTMQTVPANTRETVLETMNEFQPFFKSLGLEGQAGFEILAKSAKNGEIALNKAGDGLKEFTIRSTDMSQTSQDAYKALGMDATKMSRTFAQGGPEAAKGFQAVVDGLLKIEDPLARSTHALSLFGSPVEDLSVEKIPDFLQALQGGNEVLAGFTGATDDATKALEGGLDHQMTAVKNSFNTALGEIAIPLLTAMLPIVQSISQFMQDNQQTLVDWGGPLLIIGAIISTIMTLVNVYMTLKPLIMGIVGAQWLWNTALLANPLTLWIIAIGVIVGLVALLLMNWDAVVEGFTAGINWIMEMFSDLGEVFSDFFNGWGEFFGGGDINANMTVGNADGDGSLPKFANGGLIKARPGGVKAIFGEASQNEVVLQEGVYNANSEAVTQLVENINNNGVSGGNTQQIFFPNADPREIEKTVVGLWKQQIGV
jgi:phage-related minor tail protein